MSTERETESHILDLGRQPGVPLDQWNDQEAADRERARREPAPAPSLPPSQPAPAAGEPSDIFKQRDGESAWEFQKRQRETVAALTADLAAARAEGERLKDTLRFIRDECDWEHQPHMTGAGDDRIGPAITRVLNEAVPPALKRNELREALAQAAALRGALEKPADNRIRNTLQDVIGSPGFLPDGIKDRVVKEVLAWAREGLTGSAGAGWLPMESLNYDVEGDILLYSPNYGQMFGKTDWEQGGRPDHIRVGNARYEYSDFSHWRRPLPPPPAEAPNPGNPAA